MKRPAIHFPNGLPDFIPPKPHVQPSLFGKLPDEPFWRPGPAVDMPESYDPVLFTKIDAVSIRFLGRELEYEGDGLTQGAWTAARLKRMAVCR